MGFNVFLCKNCFETEKPYNFPVNLQLVYIVYLLINTEF